MTDATENTDNEATDANANEGERVMQSRPERLLQDMIISFMPIRTARMPMLLRRMGDDHDRTGGWHYRTFKELANMVGVPVNTLLAMVPASDPFYIGPDSDNARETAVGRAEWLAPIWQRLDYHRPVHDRRLHYAIMSLGDVEVTLTRNRRTLYSKGDEFWVYLQSAVWCARYLHLVPFDMIEDKRNPEPENTFHLAPEDPTLEVLNAANANVFRLSLPSFPIAPWYELRNYATNESTIREERQIADQRYYLEVWVEKTTQNDILLPWCRAHGATLVPAAGHQSVPSTYQCVRRILAHGKPAVLLYISDFDKDGLNMPLEIARKIERFVRVEFKDRDVPPIILKPVALTYEQVKRYNLPDMPLAKPTSKPARAWYERFDGIGNVELDALTVLVPGELIRLLDAAAAPYWDDTLGDRIAEADREFSTTLAETEKEIANQHQEVRDGLEKRWDAATEAARKLFEPIWADITTEYATIAAELSDAMPGIPDLPEAPEADPALNDDVFFDSTRGYLTQLAYYRQYKTEVMKGETLEDESEDDTE